MDSRCSREGRGIRSSPQWPTAGVFYSTAQTQSVQIRGRQNPQNLQNSRERVNLMVINKPPIDTSRGITVRSRGKMAIFKDLTVKFRRKSGHYGAEVGALRCEVGANGETKSCLNRSTHPNVRTVRCFFSRYRVFMSQTTRIHSFPPGQPNQNHPVSHTQTAWLPGSI